jgi:S-DNA-T family DNA segregation ATPase FtsK/SpoIIIE
MSNEDKMNKKKSNFPVLQGLLAVIILLLSILFLVAISVDIMTLIDDYKTLKDADLTFLMILKLDFPSVNNPIGPFGVFFGFWLIYVFGRFLSISLLLSTALLGFFSIFLKNEKNLVGKIISFIFFALFFNLIIFIVRGSSIMFAGIIPWKAFEFFIGIFDRTGTLIISIIIVITSLIIIFELENVKNFFILVFKFLSILFKFLFSIFKKRDKVSKIKKKKQVSILSEKEPKIFPKIEPTIVDHAAEKQFPISEDKKQEIKTIPKKFVKPISGSTSEPGQEYKIPDIETFLTSSKLSRRDIEETKENIKIVSTILIRKLSEFGVEAEVINVNIGPIITQYEIKPAPGVKVNKFNALADDLALAIKAISIRIQAPIPGRGLVGIEVPNINRDVIYLKDILLSDAMKSMKSKLAICLGKDIAGNSIVDDLSLMPHLLIAGATGSGKSVCVNTIITTFLFRTTPEEVRFILIDPKRIELSGYEGIPHLIQNVVTNNEDALQALNWSVHEMERRYDLLQKYAVKNLKAYNEKIDKLKKKGEEPEDDKKPNIIIIVDELADLMMTIGREIERPITRLAQMARAIGIHLVLATQRPSIKVITGIIKANFPSRIAFQVSSKVDSRVIIDANGAEKLLGLGDMLFLPPGKGTTIRIHGAYILPPEVHNLVEYLRTQPKPEQDIEIISEEETSLEDFEYDDELFPEAAVAVVTADSASVSMLQRHFKIGYARAGRLIDMLERAGIVGPHVGSKSREVLATEEDMKIYGYIKY